MALYDRKTKQTKQTSKGAIKCIRPLKALALERSVRQNQTRRLIQNKRFFATALH